MTDKAAPEVTSFEPGVFKALTDNANDGILMSGADGVITYANEALHRMFGYDYESQEMVGLPGPACWPKEILPRVREEIIPAAVAAGWSGEVPQQRKDGTVFTASVTAFPVEAGQDDVSQMATIVRDITARKQAEEEIERARIQAEQETTFSNTVLNSMPGIFYVYDKEGRLIRWNDNFVQALGYTDEELRDKAATDFIAEADRELVASRLQAVFVEGEAIAEADLLTKAGEEIPHYFTGQRVFIDGEPYLVGMGLDISERKKAEEQVRASQQRLALMIEQTPLAVIEWDLDFQVTAWNPAAEEIFGYTAEEAMGCHAAELMVPEEARPLVNQVWESLLEQEGGTRSTNANFTKEGREIMCEWYNAPMVDADDNVIGVSSLVADVTERQAAEAERERLQQEIIDAQQRAIQELSTPVIPVMDNIIVMPLVGSIDTLRAKDIMRTLLGGIREHKAKVVILDITGVPIMDSGVANHLNKTIQAARLKGATTVVTGISDAVAETIIDLGIDWSKVDTLGDLQTGLLYALNRLGVQLTKA